MILALSVVSGILGAACIWLAICLRSKKYQVSEKVMRKWINEQIDQENVKRRQLEVYNKRGRG